MEMTLRGLLCAQIFRLWDSRQLPLPEIRIREEILRAENPWTRALASLTFPKTPGTRNVKQIALDLRSGYLDRRGAEVHALVNQFGDSSYRTRERATRNLVALGEYADVPIRMALSRASDTEQRERLLAALKEIDSDPCPDSLRAIRAIEALGSPEALALLQMLAKESSDFRYSTSASLAANRLKKKQR